MAKRQVGIVNFEKAFTDILKQYTDDVVEAINEEVVETSKDGAELLQQVRQPSASEMGTAHPMTRREWKNYSNSWQSKVTNGQNFIHTSIHNKKHYRLTHLLEFGHATKDGMRTRAFRHIEPIELYCDERITRNLPKIVEKGGKL